jgi:Family of unknown function (DUF5670)
MFIVLGILLLLMWIVGFTTMHVASFAIHLLLLGAVISLVVHFIRPQGSGPA